MLPLDPFHEFAAAFTSRLQSGLPGEAAQYAMTARAPQLSVADYLEQNPDHRKSAVLMLLFPGENGPNTALIVRPEYDGAHSGQLAFPGGRAEKTDASLLHTALRETREEVGIKLEPDAVIGKLSPVYIPVSNFLVQPFVAVMHSEPRYYADPREVVDIINVPLQHFLDADVKTKQHITVGKNMRLHVPGYTLGDRLLWGATAMMMSEVEYLLRN